MKITKIISGGQTGADRGGLEAAKTLKIPTGGFCPKGFLTEKGTDLSLKKFHLKETVSNDYRIRTVKNVKIGDGTVIFGRVDKLGNLISRGGILTQNTCIKFKKPLLINPTAKKFITWLNKNQIKILNIAGDRESNNKGIEEKVKSFLLKSGISRSKTYTSVEFQNK